MNGLKGVGWTFAIRLKVNRGASEKRLVIQVPFRVVPTASYTLAHFELLISILLRLKPWHLSRQQHENPKRCSGKILDFVPKRESYPGAISTQH